MKTSNKAVAKTIAVSLDEVIFSNRNQNYGAFYLRKQYSKNLFFALLLVVPIFLAGTCSVFYKYYKSIGELVQKPPDTMITVVPESINFDIPKVPPPPKEPSIEIPKPAENGPIAVVDTVPENNSTLDNLLNEENQVSDDTVDWSKITVLNPPKNDPVDENPDAYIVVQESATFRGENIIAFIDWVKNNLVYPADASIAEIQGRANVTFVVNKKGEVSDIKILRGIHPLIDQEINRVLMSSPLWEPAKQNGRPVKQLFSIPIYFVIH
jgi:periplasmic protein TonB